MPSFTSAFVPRELVGWFRWDEDLTDRLAAVRPSRSWLYHACHLPRLRSYDRAGKLYLGSHFNAIANQNILTTDCIWLSLQAWHLSHGHNYYGPFTIKVPLDNLDGRRFYVFERSLNGWHRYYLVQREDIKPLFGKGKGADHIDPTILFRRAKSKLDHCDQTQYEVVLTEPVSLKRHKYRATAHQACVSSACGGRVSEREAKAKLRGLLDTKLEELERIFGQFDVHAVTSNH
jgi:hypothetical protein